VIPGDGNELIEYPLLLRTRRTSVSFLDCPPTAPPASTPCPTFHRLPLPTGCHLGIVFLMRQRPELVTVLEAVVAYPEIRSRVAAVVSVAGSVGGSPLANDAAQYQADLLRYFPGATCGPGDGGAVASLRPATREAWLARNLLPPECAYGLTLALQAAGQRLFRHLCCCSTGPSWVSCACRPKR
jgi:hypothetical protein